ncbi:MAG: metallophosphoesterase family protein [Thermodesulfobacteriota bacterium]
MTRLAHVSDLHFGTVKPVLAAGLLDSLNRLQPDLVVVSGDLTQRARSRQYRAAREYLDKIPFPKIVVPGNHDVPLYHVYNRFFHPLRNYMRYITTDLAPMYQDDKVAVLGINTARSFTRKDGRVSVSQIRLIYQRFCELPPDVFRVLVTHHPFLSPPGRPKRVVGRAERALQYLEKCRLGLVLSGHYHMSYADGSHAAYRALQRSVLVVQAGTATSRRVRKERNAFNFIQRTEGKVVLDVHMWDGGAFAPVRREVFQRNGRKRWEKRENTAIPPGLRHTGDT